MKINEELWAKFLGFTKYDRMTGGPDTHLDMIAHMSKGMNWHEAAWLAGCYASVYNVPGGFFIWDEFSWKRIREEPQELLPWIEKNWNGIPFRRERRTVRTITKLNRHLLSYSNWLSHWDPRSLEPYTAEQSYLIIWNQIKDNVWGFGRYALMKLLETYERQKNVNISCPDIRPVGGDHPRKVLSDLFLDESLAKGNDEETLANIDAAVAFLRYRIEREGVPLTMFQAEVYLCEFGQALEKNQYPGRALDSEYGHYVKATEWFGDWEGFWRIRSEMFPDWALGEKQGWEGRRKELGACLPDHQYIWSDSLYDYKKTKTLKEPIRLETLHDGAKPVCECRYAERNNGSKVHRD